MKKRMFNFSHWRLVSASTCVEKSKMLPACCSNLSAWVTAVFLSIWVFSYANAAPNTGWQSDLDYFESELSARHIDPFHNISQETFLAEVEKLRARVEGLSPEEFRVSLMDITRMIGDGHTAVPLWSDDLKRYPFEITFVDGEAIVTGASADDAYLLGSTLTRINQVPIDSVRERIARISPFVENQYSERVRSGMYLLIEDILEGLHIVNTDEGTSLEFLIGTEHRSIITEAITSQEFNDLVIERLGRRHPQKFFQRQPGGSDTLWFGERDDGRTVYVQFDRYPPHETMRIFGERLLTHMNSRRTEHLIIDLRENFGGDFYVGLSLMSYLNLADSIDWQEGVYVLIGNRTFSAAMSNAAQFRQLLNAKLVGAPTGGQPCGYQDMGQFNLPSSNLTVTYSKRRFCFIETNANTILPDVAINAMKEDFLIGQDRALEWVVQQVSKDH